MTWLTDRFRNLRYGLRNMWLFRREVWRWRGWDYQYDYDLFVRGLRLTADHIEEHDLIEDAARVAREMRHAADTWGEYTDGWYGDDIRGLEGVTLELQAWRQFHAICADAGRGWWD